MSPESSSGRTVTEKVNAAAENAYLKLGVRLFPFVLALLGWFAIDLINGVRTKVDEVKIAVDSTKKEDTEARKTIWSTIQSALQSQQTITTNLSVLAETVKSNRERSDDADRRLSDQVQKSNDKLDVLLQKGSSH